MDKNTFINKRTELVAEKVIKSLEKRHMKGYFAKDKEEALKIALSLISEGSLVGWGGSFSIEEIGLKDAVKAGPYKYIDRDTAKNMDERMEMMRDCLTSDVFLMGTNAISGDGQLVNIDGGGNRVAALCFGPKSVIVIAGINKLTKTLEDAISRARNYASPVNAMRFDSETGCHKNGSCVDCTMDGCICGQIVVTRNILHKDRIKVILVNEELGF